MPRPQRAEQFDPAEISIVHVVQRFARWMALSARTVVGHSRGGYVVMELARELLTGGPGPYSSFSNIPVRYLGLYDPVDMVLGWGDSETIPPNVEHSSLLLAAGTPAETGPDPETDFWVDPETGIVYERYTYRRSRWYFNRADAGAESDATDLLTGWLFATHAAIGGAPWRGDTPEGHDLENDIAKAIESDVLVRGKALESDVPIMLIDESGYGYEYIWTDQPTF